MKKVCSPNLNEQVHSQPGPAAGPLPVAAAGGRPVPRPRPPRRSHALARHPLRHDPGQDHLGQGRGAGGGRSRGSPPQPRRAASSIVCSHNCRGRSSAHAPFSVSVLISRCSTPAPLSFSLYRFPRPPHALSPSPTRRAFAGPRGLAPWWGRADLCRRGGMVHAARPHRPLLHGTADAPSLGCRNDERGLTPLRDLPPLLLPLAPSPCSFPLLLSGGFALFAKSPPSTPPSSFLYSPSHSQSTPHPSTPKMTAPFL